MTKELKKEKTEYNPFGPRTKRWKNLNGATNPSLMQISLYIFTKDNEYIEQLIVLGMYGNRTDAIRYYMKKGIKQDFKAIKFLEKLKAYDNDEIGLILAKKRIEKHKQIQNLNRIPNSVFDLMKSKNNEVKS